MCLICFWTPPDESMNGKVSKPDGMASVKRIRGGVCIFYSPLPHPNLPWPCLVCLRLKVQPCCSLLFAMTSATVLSCFFADLSNPTRPQKLKHKLPSSFCEHDLTHLNSTVLFLLLCPRHPCNCAGTKALSYPPQTFASLLFLRSPHSSLAHLRDPSCMRQCAHLASKLQEEVGEHTLAIPLCFVTQHSVESLTQSSASNHIPPFPERGQPRFVL